MKNILVSELRRSRLNVVGALVSSVLLAACGDSSQINSTSQAKTMAFVACPSFRDVGNTILANSCWVVDYKGQRYSLDNAVGVPQLGHSVLVEAVDAGGSSTECNGHVLQTVYVSVMPELNSQCETVLPAEGVVLPAPSGPAPGSSGSTTPPTPYASTQYVVEFPSQSSNIGTINSTASTLVGTAANLAILGKAKQVVVTGYATSTKLDDGTLLTESSALAEARAERVALALAKLQVPSGIVSTTWVNAVPVADGTNAHKGRVVTISVQL